MKKVLSPVLIAASLLLSGLSAAAADSVRSIAETNVHQWNSALEQRDLDRIMALYTDNAILLQPNGSVSQTPDAIRAFWRSVLESANVGYSFDVEEIQKTTSTIVLAAKWFNRTRLSASVPHRVRRGYDGKMTNVLVRQDDGSWKAQVQRWN